jgi:hypothetical protein
VVPHNFHAPKMPIDAFVFAPSGLGVVYDSTTVLSRTPMPWLNKNSRPMFVSDSRYIHLGGAT